LAESSRSKFAAHAKRDKSGLLDPKRDPNAITDTHTTKKAPKSGQHSGDVIKTPDGHAGADTRGL